MNEVSETIVELRDIRVVYGNGSRTVEALRGVSLDIRRGEIVTVMGPSGSGKTSLLSVIAGFARPASGSVHVKGRDISKLRDRELSRMRRHDISYIAQFFNLLPRLHVRENVAIPLRADGVAVTEINQRVDTVLDKVGLLGRAHHLPDELSGGEMQRVAIARALAADATLLLADEPTGNLDTRRSEEILCIFRDLVENDGRSVLLVTHDPRAGAYGDRMLTLRDGKITAEVRGEHHGGDLLSLGEQAETLVGKT